MSQSTEVSEVVKENTEVDERREQEDLDESGKDMWIGLPLSHFIFRWVGGARPERGYGAVLRLYCLSISEPGFP